MPIPPKSKPKFIQQHHKLSTLPKFHKPPTLSKLHHGQKYNTSKMVQSQDYKMTNLQCPKFQQEYTTTQWQCLNIKLSIPNLKFSIPSFKFSIPNFKFSIPNFKFSILSFKFQIPNFKFQFSNLKIPKSQVSKFQSFNFSKFQNSKFLV